jgi:hypothetical protein
MNLSVEHVLMIVLVAFALHYLMRNCGCRVEGLAPLASHTKAEGECCHWGDCRIGLQCDISGVGECNDVYGIGWSGKCRHPGSISRDLKGFGRGFVNTGSNVFKSLGHIFD